MGEKKMLCFTEVYRGLQRFLFCGVLVSVLIFAACNKTHGSVYTVTFGVDGANGMLTARVGGKDITQSPLVGLSSGTKVNFIAKPDNGYTVKQWMLNGKPVSGTTTYTLVVKDKSSVTVQFMKESEKPAPQPSVPPTSAVTHKVTIKPSEHGDITSEPALSESGLVQDGTEMKFTAKAHPGYKVNVWSVTGGTVIGDSSAGSVTVTVKITADTTVSVSFIGEKEELTAYPVKFSAAVTGGTLTAKVGEKTITSGDKVRSGAEVTFTAEPKTGYMLKNWIIDGTATGGAASTHKIRITKATEVTAVFEKYYMVELEAPEHGTLTVSPELKDGKVAENTELTFTATPAERYEVAAWTVSQGSAFTEGGAAKQTSAKLTVTKDVKVGVAFKLKTFTVTYSGSPDPDKVDLSAKYEDGTPVPASPATVELDKKVVFTVTYDPATTDKLIQWTITGSSAESGGKRGDKTATITVTKDTNVAVTLVPISAADILNRLPALPTETDHDFSLTSQLAGQNITWESSKPDAITIENGKAIVTRNLVDQPVKLTAKLTQGSDTATREFSVTVKALTRIEMTLSGNRKVTYIFENGNLEVMREGNGNTEGHRYVVTVPPNGKTLTAGLMAEYRNGVWNTFAEAKMNEKKEAEKAITIRQQLEAKDILDVSIVKAAFGQMELTDEDFCKRNRDLFGNKNYQDFDALLPAEKTAIIKASIAQQRKIYCAAEGLPETASWAELLERAIENIEKRYSFAGRSVLYKYQLTKNTNGDYSITIQSKYMSETPWYEQKGAYKADSEKLTISVYEGTEKLYITLNGMEYSGRFTDGGTRFTAKDQDGNNEISGDIQDQRNGVLNVTINGMPYRPSFTPVDMR